MSASRNKDGLTVKTQTLVDIKRALNAISYNPYFSLTWRFGVEIKCLVTFFLTFRGMGFKLKAVKVRVAVFRVVTQQILVREPTFRKRYLDIMQYGKR
jgi:hypothetical protein